jgi:hypothetical protein
MTPEDKAVARVLNALTVFPGVWGKNPRTRWGRSGRPDIWGVYYGHPIFIEVKRFDGKGSYGVTPTQQRLLIKLERAGAIVGVVDSEKALEDFISRIRQIGAAYEFEAGRDPQREGPWFV